MFRPRIRQRSLRRLWVLCWTAWLGGGLAAAGPQSAGQPAAGPATSSPERRSDRLHLDIDKHVERLLAGSHELPRFETSVEVQGKLPQLMLERFFAGFDLECGPAEGGSPSEGEMRAYRQHPSPFLDLSALSAALAKKLKPKGPARYFLYRVERQDQVSYSLREDEIPESWSLNLPGTRFELLGSFETRGQAVTAWRRAHRGEKELIPPSAQPLQPYVTATCRPRPR